MKKVVLSFAVLLLLTGCGSNKKEENAKKNIIESVNKVEGLEQFSDLMVLDSNSITSEIGLKEEDLDFYLGVVPYYLDSTFYIVLKPSNDNQTKIEKFMDDYINNKKNRMEVELTLDENQNNDGINKQIEMLDNMLKEEYKDYLIYISSSDNKAILNILKKQIDEIN